jgi:hypothetical protein
MWSTIFDEAYAEAGATDRIISQFVASVGSPLSTKEASDISKRQQNPFPESDRFIPPTEALIPAFGRSQIGRFRLPI